MAAMTAPRASARELSIGAPNVTGTGWWPGADAARGISLDPTDPSGTSGYVADKYGGIHEFGTAPSVTTTGWWPGQDAARGGVVEVKARPLEPRGDDMPQPRREGSCRVRRHRSVADRSGGAAPAFRRCA